MAAEGHLPRRAPTRPFTPYRGSEAAFKRTVANLRDAWEKKVPLTFSTDMDYWNERMKDEKTGEWLTRGELTINFLLTWKAAGIPPADVLRAMTINGYKAADVIKRARARSSRGSTPTSSPCRATRSTDIDALRNVQFVMKNGMVFKKDGVMMPEKFFHPGPVRTPNGRWTR